MFFVSNVTVYSRLPDKRAGWNKRAGGQIFFHLLHEKKMQGAQKKSISEAPRLLDI